MALEATGTGVTTALAAGMRVVAVQRAYVDPAELDPADRVVARLSADVLS